MYPDIHHEVCLVSVPQHASAQMIAEIISPVFGALGPRGVIIWHQERLTERGECFYETNATCQFHHPASASAALAQGWVSVMGTPVKIDYEYGAPASPSITMGGQHGMHSHSHAQIAPQQGMTMPPGMAPPQFQPPNVGYYGGYGAAPNHHQLQHTPVQCGVIL